MSTSGSPAKAASPAKAGKKKEEPKKPQGQDIRKFFAGAFGLLC
jgi:hypothetical protein